MKWLCDSESRITGDEFEQIVPDFISGNYLNTKIPLKDVDWTWGDTTWGDTTWGGTHEVGGVLVSVLNSLHFCIYCPNSGIEIRVLQMPKIII